MTKLYLGIDPGRSKTGLALVNGAGKIVKLHIAESQNIDNEIVEFIKNSCPVHIVLGNGTNSRNIGESVKRVLPDVMVTVVEEAHSTEEARTLYWQENPPKGLKKLIPLGMLVPPVPLDAYAAVILVRRFLEDNYE
ncbi:MAG: pre-16S rRNA-processing nuclease YqgF [Phascolarctobacterium sp.]|nr:pre-16S rRNA-processing nuclease YqgF [Phascolarctobacterium sp.]